VNVCLVSQIAALSPADINYDETLSTLRYGELSFTCFKLVLQPIWVLFYLIQHCILRQT